MKKDAGEGTPGLATCSFIAQAVSRFGEPTHAAHALEEPGLQPTDQPTGKPGGALRRPEPGGGREWWVRVVATAAPGRRGPETTGGKPQRRLSVARTDPSLRSLSVSCLLRRLSGSTLLKSAGRGDISFGGSDSNLPTVGQRRAETFLLRGEYKPPGVVRV